MNWLNIISNLWVTFESILLFVLFLFESVFLLFQLINNELIETEHQTGYDQYCDSSFMSLKCPQVLCPRLTEDVSREEHFSRLLHDCRHKLTSLQERMSLLKAQNDGQITDVTALEVRSIIQNDFVIPVQAPLPLKIMSFLPFAENNTWRYY